MIKKILSKTFVSIGIIGLIWGCELEDIETVTTPETNEEQTDEETSREEEEQEDSTNTSENLKIPEFGETKAFPSAEGYGRYTPGGRGGKTVYVTSLKDTRERGTLRYALEEVSGPRTILFKVAGIIELADFVKIKEPYVTIAGQSAPGSGITLKNSGILIETHDVIIRHLRIRPGDNPDMGTYPSDRDGLVIYKNRNCNNIMLDQVSFTWGIDENVSFSTGTNNITIQKCIIAEGLSHSLHHEGEHSKGLLMLNDLDNISIVNNLFAHNLNRNPLISSNSRNVHVINNLVYNWGPIRPGYGTHTQIFEDEVPINDAVVYRNLYRKGPTSSDLPVYRTGNWYLVDGSTFFIDDNYIDDDGEIEALKDVSSSFHKYPDFFDSFMVDQPPSNWDRSYAEVRNINEVADFVLENAGARQPIRDEVDERIVDEVRNHTGDFIDSPSDRGGYPDQFRGTVPKDSDGDGIPDKWEIQKDLNPDNADDALENTLSPYYNNLEMYLNELAGDYKL